MTQPARKHHGDNIAYELLLEAYRSALDKAYYMYEADMTDKQAEKAAAYARKAIIRAAQPIITRLADAGYDFGDTTLHGEEPRP